MFKKIKVFKTDLLIVSKLTRTKQKKIKILLLALILNFLIFLDILIILFFSSIFAQDVGLKNFVVEYILENKIFFPIAILLRYFFNYFQIWLTTKLQLDIENNLRVHLMGEIFKKGNYSISDAYFYVNTISSQVGYFYSTLALFFGSLLQIFIFTSYLIFSNPQVVIYFILGATFLSLPTLFLTKLGRKFAHRAYLNLEESSKSLEKVLDNLFLIKIVDNVSKEISSYREALSNYSSSRFNEISLGTINSIVPNFFTLFSLSIILIFFNGLRYITFDFIGIILRLFQSLGVFNKNIHILSAFHIYIQKLYEIESNKGLENSKNFKVSDKYLDTDNAVELKNVSFSYFKSDQLNFKNLDLTLKRNKHTIITGPNGSGKSTLLGLISGVFYPTSGTVTVFTNKFGYVGTKPLILNSSLKENLLYGSKQISSDKEMVDYLKLFKTFESELDYKLDRVISNKTLSSGQMQKIGFIRTILSKAEILLLDEATSNLDTQSKEIIYQIIDKLDLTIINSTHNPDEVLSYDYHIQISDLLTKS